MIACSREVLDGQELNHNKTLNLKILDYFQILMILVDDKKSFNAFP